MRATIAGTISLATWRSIFGSIHCPPEWCPFSGITTGASNDLLAYGDWDPLADNSLVAHLMTPPDAPDPTLLFFQAREACASVDPFPKKKNYAGAVDVFGTDLWSKY